MTKQKKTIAKPARAGTKARKQPAEAAAAPKTKLGQLEGMLRRTEGATIAQIVAATDWAAHTVRGFFAGALKKKLGLSVTSEKVEGKERVYRGHRRLRDRLAGNRSRSVARAAR